MSNLFHKRRTIYNYLKLSNSFSFNHDQIKNQEENEQICCKLVTDLDWDALISMIRKTDWPLGLPFWPCLYTICHNFEMENMDEWNIMINIVLRLAFETFDLDREIDFDQQLQILEGSFSRAIFDRWSATAVYILYKLGAQFTVEIFNNIMDGCIDDLSYMPPSTKSLDYLRIIELEFNKMISTKIIIQRVRQIIHAQSSRLVNSFSFQTNPILDFLFRLYIVHEDIHFKDHNPFVNEFEPIITQATTTVASQHVNNASPPLSCITQINRFKIMKHLLKHRLKMEFYRIVEQINKKIE
jgi:hypothetical protein